ncbi:MAG TPA: lytic murein transglycosylase [Xanthobacteraceae bacterium]|nr:lytic murein transglycosylase [Xanthobacteraceae bacterium]
MAVAAALMGAAAGPARAANCQTQSFERWLDGVRQEAAAQGVSATGLAALDGLAFDPAIVRRDHGQGVFQQSFLQFSDRMAAGYRIQGGIAMIKRHADLFARIEKQYGVPPPVITAFWALESDFGSNNGNYPILRAVATLAYDCRRPEFFRAQLIDALRIVQRGDLRASEMIGDWAGELGPLQFTPSDYYKYAVDFDGDGRRDLIHSVPDVLASGANFLVGLGWKRGEPWLQEVRAPAAMPWEEADLSIKHPRSQWAKWGVTLADGRPLPADDMPASLLLLMGRLGPAFLAYDNFRAYLGWNASLVYSTTAAYLATRIAGAPPLRRGSPNIPVLSAAQILDMQQLLVRRGFSTEKPDGKLGLTTRAGVRAAQVKLGLPADAYPTAELIERLRAR